MTGTLEKICERKRSDVKSRRSKVPFGVLDRQARQAPPPRGFVDALRKAARRPALIAELKKASPSKGLIREDFAVPALASAYESGGAACLSVLTEEHWFCGADAYIAAAKDAASLPVLRKDFTVDIYQVAEARALGADAILLIVAALTDEELRDFAAAAADYDLDVLVEIHKASELDRALALDMPLLGINNRDLRSLEVDLRTFERLAPLVPEDRLLIAESGIGSRADLERLAASGAGAFLVGETLMRQDDVAAATRALLEG